MTCPTPDYCGVNGCTNSACHPSRQPPTWAAVPAPTRPPWGRLALGLLCLLAPYAAVAAVMAALWVLT